MNFGQCMFTFSDTVQKCSLGFLRYGLFSVVSIVMRVQSTCLVTPYLIVYHTDEEWEAGKKDLRRMCMLDAEDF